MTPDETTPGGPLPPPNHELQADGTTPPPQEDLPSLPSRMIGALFSPGATFRRISGRPVWTGALAAYLVIVAVATLTYSLKVDWESMLRGQLESSLGWKITSSFLPENQLDQAEHAMMSEVLSIGRNGMALNSVLNSVIGTTLVFQIMLILFATLFYLMGSLADLKLGRIYLDGLLAILIFILFAILNAVVRGIFGGDSLAALPYQAGLASIFFIGYFWFLRRSIERQPDFKRLAATYAHAMAVPALAMLVLMVVVVIKSGAVTAPADQVVQSSIAGMLSMKGAGPLTVMLGALDIFTLWGLVVAAIGFASATRLSLGASIAITFLPWGFYTMARIAIAAAFGG
ncbi:MAG TPA: hypothetical protein VNI57_05300 [Candidatus Saccharimonadales bacterium]|nr:hypothetical protein [Candidatus Saccharimonadales bacterium]